jgi:hypothetical protein
MTVDELKELLSKEDPKADVKMWVDGKRVDIKGIQTYIVSKYIAKYKTVFLIDKESN